MRRDKQHKLRRVLHTASACVCLWVVIGTPEAAEAQLDPRFDVGLTEPESSAGFESYAALSSAARGANQVSKPVSGSLGVYLTSDFWWWAETSKMTPQYSGGDVEMSVWPIAGTRWGLEGGAFLSGHLNGCLMCAGEQSAGSPGLWQASQWLRLRSGFLNIVQMADYQRSAEFDDTYWRAERNVSSFGLGMELPFALRYEDKYGVRVDFAKFSVFGRQLLGLEDASVLETLEFDIGMTMLEVGVEHTYSSFVGRFVSVDANIFEAPASGGADAVAGPISVRFALADMQGISFDDGRHTFGLSGGFRLIRPASLLASEGLVTDDGEPAGIQPELMVSFANHDGLGSPRASSRLWRAFDEFTYRIGAGTFYRIGPSGLAVDEGWKLQLGVATPIDERWSLEAKAVGVTATRTMVEDVPTVDVDGPGTGFLMGRAELGLSRQLGERLMLSAGLWGERSDRYDPSPTGLFSAAPGQVRFRLGATASLTGRLY